MTVRLSPRKLLCLKGELSHDYLYEDPCRQRRSCSPCNRGPGSGAVLRCALGNAYGYNNNVTNMAAQRCAAAVQSRLHSRTNAGGLLGAILGVNTATTGRVLNVTQVTPRRNNVLVRGLASSGRNMGYGQYGYGAYGAPATPTSRTCRSVARSTTTATSATSTSTADKIDIPKNEEAPVERPALSFGLSGRTRPSRPWDCRGRSRMQVPCRRRPPGFATLGFTGR